MTRGAKNTGRNKIVDIVVTKVWLTSDDSGSDEPVTPPEPESTILYNSANNQDGAGNWSAFAPSYDGVASGGTWAKIKDDAGNIGPATKYYPPIGCAKRDNGLEIWFQNVQGVDVINNGAFGSNKKYKVGNYSTLRITATRASSRGPNSEVSPWHRCVAGITKEKKCGDGTGDLSFPGTVLGDLAPGTNDYDISNYSGDYYIYFGGASKATSAFTGTGGVDILVTRIELR
jgi:hypothetical protein